jgi:hypothetical protein
MTPRQITRPVSDLERRCPEYRAAMLALDEAMARNDAAGIEKHATEARRVANIFWAGVEHAQGAR